MSGAKARVESLSQVGGQAGGCCTLERQGMGHGTRPHDWKLDESDSMKLSLSRYPNVSTSLLYFTDLA